MNEREEFITKEKHQSLTEELKDRKTNIRSEILERLEFAKSLGDLSENAEYHSSKDAQGKNEARIREIEDLLKHAVLITEQSGDTVSLGCTVIIKNEKGREQTYTLVGPQDADVGEGKLSYQCPTGIALMDKKVGDEVSVDTPRGEKKYQIVKIN